ncbi:Limb region 1 -like protein [Trichinella zimbabwensis]|uniref:Limb region 1-like protein n=2 Tax=Trichinella TaxID=6333 RepID=A0A0V1N722_9BILA|nr:Limb region 1 -like protein [Trichinella zimbabwensis]KRZ79809.1 Limb region 1 -like protein [Trichinella papuae]
MSPGITNSEIEFQSSIREPLVSTLLFVILYVCSYILVGKFRLNPEEDELFSGEDSDAIVFRISFWICTFSTAVSLSAILLVPFSIFSNEILLLYSKNYYIQWLSSSLMKSLWNSVFACSNLCIFILLPFAYFLIESHGFGNFRFAYNIWTRVLETTVNSFFLVVLSVLLVQTVIFFLEKENCHPYTFETCFNMRSFIITAYTKLPVIYSYISMFGVGLSLACTPLGFGRIFAVFNVLIPEARIRNKIINDLQHLSAEEMHLVNKAKTSVSILKHTPFVEEEMNVIWLSCLRNLANLYTQRKLFEKELHSISWLSVVIYPVLFLVILAITALSVLSVMWNVFQIIIGFRRLPIANEDFELGSSSLSFLGFYGAFIEIIITLYLMLASFIGFYSLPVFCRLKPIQNGTSMTRLIFNCTSTLVLSSALPVLARVLGLTNFDLLGNYSQLNWLGNIYFVLMYNLMFTFAVVCVSLTLLQLPFRLTWILRLAVKLVARISSSGSASLKLLVLNYLTKEVEGNQRSHKKDVLEENLCSKLTDTV